MSDKAAKGGSLPCETHGKDEDSDSSLPCVSYDEEEVLTTAKVLEFFEMVNNPEVTISVPPVCPKGGEVNLFVPESSDTRSKKVVEFLMYDNSNCINTVI